MTEESLTHRTSASVLWMTAQKWVSRIGGLIAVIVLTRTLPAEDFGLAAAATTLLPLLYVLSDLGFSSYLIQAKEVAAKTLSTAFWFSLLTGAVLAGAVAGAAPLLGMVLRLPAVVPLLQAMAVSVLMIAASSVPMSLMRRRMAFRSLAVMEVSGVLLAQVVAITVALLGGGVWALVLQTMVAQVVATIWVWTQARWRPSAQFSVAEFKAMASFGLHVLGSELVMVTRAWAETAIIVAGIGVREMGYLNIAQRLVQTAQDLSVSALMPVSMVAFSKVRDDPDRLRSSYLRASSISHAVVTPLMVVVAVTAPVLVPFLFGSDKVASASIAPALAVIALINVGWAIDQGLHIGIGRPGRWLALITVAYSITVGIQAIAVQYGLAVLLLAWIGGVSIEAVIRWFATGPLVHAPAWRMAIPLVGVALPAAVAAGVGLGCMTLLRGAPDLVTLAVTGLAVVASYLLALRLIRPGTVVDTVGVLPRRLSRRLQWALPKKARQVSEVA